VFPSFEPNEKYVGGLVVPNRSAMPFLNRLWEGCVRSVSGSVFHVRVVFGMNDRWKDVVRLAGSVSVP